MTEADQSMLREALAEALPQLTPIEPDARRGGALRARVLARARAQPAPPQAFTIHADQGRWYPICAGVECKLLHQNEAVKSFLLKLAPGAEVPAHEHPAADEECLVLEGEAVLGDLRLQAGAYHLAPKGSLHAGNLRSETGALVLIHTGAGNPPRFAQTMR